MIKKWLIKFFLPRAGKWVAAEIKDWLDNSFLTPETRAIVLVFADAANEPLVDLPKKMDKATGGKLGDKSLMDFAAALPSKDLYNSLVNFQKEFNTEPHKTETEE
jgi:hypothetical protein